MHRTIGSTSRRDAYRNVLNFESIGSAWPWKLGKAAKRIYIAIDDWVIGKLVTTEIEYLRYIRVLYLGELLFEEKDGVFSRNVLSV